jgi:hypothetical protein
MDDIDPSGKALGVYLELNKTNRFWFMVFSHLMYLVCFLREIRHLLALYANCGKPETFR